MISQQSQIGVVITANSLFIDTSTRWAPSVGPCQSVFQSFTVTKLSITQTPLQDGGPDVTMSILERVDCSLKCLILSLQTML